MTNSQAVHSLLLLFFILGLAGQAHAAQAADVAFNTLPHEGTSLDAFVPKGWKVDFQVSGDLNGDGVPDIAAILIEDKPDDNPGDSDEGPARAFIVVLGKDNGKFVLAGRNDKLLQCKGCGGIKDMVDIRIQKGVLVVYQMSGSRWYTLNTWRFRYDPESQRFVLIGMDSESGDNARGTKKMESSNYLTGLKTIQEGKKTSKEALKAGDSSKKTPFLEDVVEEGEGK